jgi:hypothetical protein
VPGTFTLHKIMSTNAQTLKLFRQMHRAFGLLIAPAVLFFAFTGVLQTFGLHESSPGSDYKPAHWIVVLAQLHKKQTITIYPKRPRPAADSSMKAEGHAPGASDMQADGPRTHDAAAAKPGSAEAAKPLAAPRPSNHLAMKIFFLIVALGLFNSTLTGIYMAYRYGGSKRTVTLLLLAGIVVPLILLAF